MCLLCQRVQSGIKMIYCLCLFRFELFGRRQTKMNKSLPMDELIGRVTAAAATAAAAADVGLFSNRFQLVKERLVAVLARTQIIAKH